jgi:hypothetical protein
MAEEKEKPGLRPELKTLATHIYVDLIGRNIIFADGSPKMPVGAENIAKLSFKLADVFLAVQDELNSANLPKNPTYKLGADDIASWMK